MMNINLNEYFQKQIKFSGNVLLSKNNEIIFNESYGYSNKEKGIKNTPQTKFMIGSMTKAITGGTYISREIASLIYGKKLGALKKIF